MSLLGFAPAKNTQLLGVPRRRKKPPVLALHGQGSRLSRRRHRPPRLHRQRAGINRHHLILLPHVVVDDALPVSDWELRPTSQRHTLHDRPLRRIAHHRPPSLATE